ncbi:MAG TPA: hypothetical protein VJT69_04005 [Pyrinomonadaceae bacterium]|nr:hypothetical protein [Pyrinomonadaceae bacterium]
MPADVVEIFDWIANGFAGWRYLFSPSYRRRTHARWKAEGRIRAFVDILFSTLSMLFTIFLIWVVVNLLKS